MKCVCVRGGGGEWATYCKDFNDSLQSSANISIQFIGVQALHYLHYIYIIVQHFNLM